MRNKLIKLALIACLILPTMIFVACGKDDDSKSSKVVDVNVYYAGEEIDTNNNIIYIEYDKVNNFIQNIEVELEYKNNETKIINQKTASQNGYVLTHNLPENVNDSYVGDTFAGSITYSHHNVVFSIYVDKKTDNISITNRLDKSYNGDAVDSPVISKLNPNIATVEWYNSNGRKLNSAPINAGAYYVKVTTTDSTTIKGASVTKTFTISKATPIPLETIVIDGLVYSPTRTLGEIDIDSHYTWKDASIIPTCNTTSYKAIYNPDKNNYVDFEVEVGVILERAEYKVDVNSQLDNQYNDKVAKVTDIALPHDNLAWINGDAALVQGVNTVSATTYPDDTTNYKSSTQTFTVNYYYIIENIPEFRKNAFLYDGGEKTVEFGNYYEEDYMEITNPTDTIQTEIGEYNVSVAIKLDAYYVWKDGATYINEVQVPWGIYSYDPYIVFELNDAQDGYIIKGYTGDATKLIIPETYQSKTDAEPLPIKIIDDSAFANCTTLKEIVLPANLEIIYESAFDNTNLTSIEFKDKTWFVAQYKYSEGSYRWVYTPVDVMDATTNVILLTDTYLEYRWCKAEGAVNF